jgi:hypothetical protein
MTDGVACRFNHFTADSANDAVKGTRRIAASSAKSTGGYIRWQITLVSS